MKSTSINFNNIVVALAIAMLPAIASAQSSAPGTGESGGSSAPADSIVIPAKPAPVAAASLLPPNEIQRVRPQDMRGLNVFEPKKGETAPFTGFKLGFGAAFTQQFQGLDHSSTAAVRMAKDATGKDYNANGLIRMGHGFNNAVANVYLNAQLAKGVRVAMTSYLSSRHHGETWVKDGYLLIDDSPLDIAPINKLMQYVTVKAGHFEINYGDAHFRRTDNGQSLHNPLVGNYIMDAFTTQVGAEVYLRGRGRAEGLFAMGSITNGEIRGTILNPQRRSAAYISKLGFDRQVSDNLRLRLTGSGYSQSRASNQTLFSGDRAGSRYYDVLENTVSSESANFTSGAINPGLSSEMHAFVVNPFVKLGGLELFGNFEQARGKSATEVARREWKQNVYEATYRFLGDKLYASARHNTVDGRPVAFTQDVSIARTQAGGGWFVLPTVLLKAEYVTQKYDNFPSTDIRSGGRFKGYVIEGAVAF